MTNKAKHTPGPWVLDTQDYINRTIEVRTQLESLVAVVYSNATANAHLIAAAPVMYELIKDALRQAQAISLNADSLAVNTNASIKANLIQLFEHAIAKAKGEV